MSKQARVKATHTQNGQNLVFSDATTRITVDLNSLEEMHILACRIVSYYRHKNGALSVLAVNAKHAALLRDAKLQASVSGMSWEIAETMPDVVAGLAKTWRKTHLVNDDDDDASETVETVETAE